MRFIISVTIVSFVTDLSWTESSIESHGEATQNPNLNVFSMVFPQPSTSAVEDANSRLNAMWAHSPKSHLVQSKFGNVDWIRQVPFRHPHYITKIAKTLNNGLDPFFSKSVFEPYEKRPKPVILVAFRKDRLSPRETLLPPLRTSKEVAELQSPYNDIGSFWQDSPLDSYSLSTP